MTPIQALAKQINPKYPENKLCRIITSQEQNLWFKVESTRNMLVLPGMNKLRANYTLLEKAIEAISSFEVMTPSEGLWNWNPDYLHVDHYYKESQIESCAFILKEMISDPPEYIACDIETRDVSWDGNRLLAIGLSWASGLAMTISGPVLQDSIVKDTLRRLFELKTIKFIWHNGKFDIGRLAFLEGIEARVDEDTMLMHYVGINETRGTHGLKDLAPLYLQAPQWDDKLQEYKRKWCRENKVKVSDFTYDMIPIEILLPYLAMDCIATFRLRALFAKLMRPEADWIYRRLIEASNVYSCIERNGIQVNTKYMADLRKELEANRDEAEKILQKTINTVWNEDAYIKDAVQDYNQALREGRQVQYLWDPEAYMRETGAKSCNKGVFTYKSPKQLKWIIERSLGHRIPDTSAATLDEIASSIEGQSSEFIKALMKVRKCNKYIDTYISGYEELMNFDDRIRCSYNLHGTETGRLSCSDPNLQNVPRDKRIKNLMCAASGYRLMQLDYSQAELRVLAYLSQDEWLLNVYRDDHDLHDKVAEEMFGPNFDKEQRVMAKTINFGIAYGRGPGSIARTFNKTIQEANDIIDRWYRPMPRVKWWIQNQRRKANLGEQCITPFGRERHFVLDSQNRNHVQNEYINTPIQSLASDFTMLSIIRIQEYIDKMQLNQIVRIVATVHDSIIIEFKDNIFNAGDRFERELAIQLKRIMETTPNTYLGDSWNLPMKADVEVGESWGALHGIDL